MRRRACAPRSSGPVLIDRYLRGRDRGRRRRAGRRRGRVRRRHHGAHRGGGHPLGRQRLLAAALLAAAGRSSPRSSARPRRWPGRCRSRGLMNVQMAVKDGEVFILEVNPRASRTVPFVAKAIGQPDRQDRRPGHGGRAAGRLRACRTQPTQPRRGQGGGVPVRPLPRRRPAARPRDEVDRRGDGPRPRFRRGLRQVAARGRHRAAGDGARCSSRSATRDKRGRGRAGPRAASSWASSWSPPRGTAAAIAAGRAAGASGQQGARGPAAHRRPDQGRRDRHGASTRPKAGRRSATATRCGARR